MIVDFIRDAAHKHGIDNSSLISWVNYLEIPVSVVFSTIVYLILMLPFIFFKTEMFEWDWIVLPIVASIVSLNPIEHLLEKNDPKNILQSSILSWLVIIVVYVGPIGCVVMSFIQEAHTFASVSVSIAYCILFYYFLSLANKEAIGYAHWKNSTIQEQFSDFYSGRTKWRTAKAEFKTMEQNLGASGGRIRRCFTGALMSPFLCACITTATPEFALFFN